MTDAEAEAPILLPADMKSWLIRKDPDAGKDWGQEENRATDGEMVGWHHWLNGFEYEQSSGDSEGQWSLECCSPWGHKELDTTLRLNNTTTTIGVDEYLYYMSHKIKRNKYSLNLAKWD